MDGINQVELKMGINRIRLLEMRERERDGKRENNGNHCMMASKRGCGKRDKKQIGQREQANAEKDVRHFLATERLWKQE